MRPKMGRPRRGDVWIWLTGSALAMSLLMIGGLVAVILVNGLGFFWPEPLVKLTLRDGSYDWEFLPEAGKTFSDAGQADCH